MRNVGQKYRVVKFFGRMWKMGKDKSHQTHPRVAL
jgi:hypothetical protein